MNSLKQECFDNNINYLNASEECAVMASTGSMSGAAAYLKYTDTLATFTSHLNRYDAENKCESQKLFGIV